MKKIYILFLVLIGVTSSCTKDFVDYNTDTKNPSEVKGEFLFSNAQKRLLDQISSTNVNLNVFKLFAQQWTETQYVDEANYNIIKRNIPDNNFSTYYRGVIGPLKQANDKILEAPIPVLENEKIQKNKLAIIDLVQVYAYHTLINTFGDIPYSSSNDIENISPKYDTAISIYNDLIKRINSDLAVLEANSSESSFTSGIDLIYNGNVSAWIKFAYSLKIKIAVNVSDVNDKVEFDVNSVISSSISKAFASSADNALIMYQGSQPNTNPLHEDLVLSGRSDFVAANTLVDLMKGVSDPRMDAYFTNKINGEYLGGIYGDKNKFSAYSHINSKIQEAQFPGILMTYSEIEFYLAEAADKGMISDDVGTHYNNAVTASFDFWGVPDVATYLTANPYSDLNSIALQSYFAAYTRGNLAYTTYRRLDYPEMNVSPKNPATDDGLVPKRFTYPVNEQTLNAKNYSEASSSIGGDHMETKLFWDLKEPVVAP